MNTRVSVILILVVSIGNVTTAAAQRTALHPAVRYGIPRFLRPAVKPPRPISTSAARGGGGSADSLDISTHFSGADGLLPTWTFRVRASRDGNEYSGTIVGHSPFGKLYTDKIPTYIVPLVIHTHRIATSIDPQTFVITATPGDTTIDSTAANNTCMTAPSNVPITVVRQSPIFDPTKFVIGGTDIGTTQYLDANQRASFWKVLGSDADNYHVLLDPIQITAPVVIDVPPQEGLAINDPEFFSAFGITICAPLQTVSVDWFDAYVGGTVLPALAEQGITPAALPILVAYNAVWPIFDDNPLGPTVIGYHNVNGYPFVTQTYAVVDFDRSGLYVGPPHGLDVDVLAHEIGEWGNDPYIFNSAPSWGNVGQDVGFCQSESLHCSN